MNETTIELLESTANMLRDMCMDPRVPQDTKEVLWSRVRKLDAADNLKYQCRSDDHPSTNLTEDRWPLVIVASGGSSHFCIHGQQLNKVNSVGTVRASAGSSRLSNRGQSQPSA